MRSIDFYQIQRSRKQYHPNHSKIPHIRKSYVQRKKEMKISFHSWQFFKKQRIPTLFGWNCTSLIVQIIIHIKRKKQEIFGKISGCFHLIEFIQNAQTKHMILLHYADLQAKTSLYIYISRIRQSMIKSYEDPRRIC